MSDEKKFKECLEILINIISDTIKNIKEQTINDFNKKIKQFFEKSFLLLSFQCQNYLLNLFNQYNYNEQEQIFLNLFENDKLNLFLYDLQGILFSLDAFKGAWNGDQAIVKTFIEKYPKLKDKSGLYQTTLLYSASRNNHINLVKYLIEIGKCSVNSQNEEYIKKDQESTLKGTIGSTALHAACFHGHLKIVKYLIEHGGDYFILNNLIETPIENGRLNLNIRNFFKDFLIFNYLNNLNNLPKKTILDEIEENNEQIIDCIWEYKPFLSDQWFSFASDPSFQLQQSLINKQFQSEFSLKASRDIYQISISQFLRSGKNNDQIENLSWIRCRGSSLRNFHCYSQWQMMFIKYPTEINNSLPSKQIFYMTKTKIQLNSWYNFNQQLNYLLETAMNYRRKYLNIYLDFINNENITFDLENFTFINQKNTIEGFLRWIPKITSDSLQLLTISQVKGNIPIDEIDQYDLKYEKAFHDDDLDFPNKQSRNINVIYGDLLTQDTDVILICISSKYLMENVFRVGGKSLQKSFEIKFKEIKKNPVISIPADGKLQSKSVYFVQWEPDSDLNKLCQSIEQLVSNVIERAASENYKSIAFPAIGCGEYRCSVNLIAQTFVRQVQQQLVKYQIEVIFVIQPDKKDIYEEFRKQIDSFEQIPLTKSASLTIEKGLIQVEKGDITKQTVDVIIGSSSSENLRQVLLKAGGDQLQSAYDNEYKNNPNSLIISTPPGHLPCKRVFFLKWDPNRDEEILRQSLIDLIWNVIQNVLSYNFTSIAFPAIGCGEHACSVDIVVKTMIREMKQQIQKRKLSWTFKFIIQPNQQNVYDEFCKQLLSSDNVSIDYQIPSTWQNSKDDQFTFIVPKNTDEYKSIANKFDEGMKGKYKQIIKIERIQNERWYMQYMAHSKDFKKRLNEDTEIRLYHGCPEQAANSIIHDCFNRSFAGVNGTSYGVGVYFSSDVTYSHGYTKPNSNGERCMFIARVLVGKTTLGNASMKTRPLGFDSTTDGNHITVTYHDAQAYAEYLITYK